MDSDYCVWTLKAYRWWMGEDKVWYSKCTMSSYSKPEEGSRCYCGRKIRLAENESKDWFATGIGVGS